MIRWLRSLSKKLLIFLNILAVAALLLAYLSTYISPEKYAFLALFGIGYGILIAINLFFVLFWLFVKKRLALISAITILIGFGHLNAYFNPFPHFNQEPGEQATELKIVSYNVRLFGWYDWKNNKKYRDSLIAGLQPEDADIYCFQEYFHNSKAGVFDTQEQIKEKLKTPYVHTYYTNYVNQYENYGIATFSKYPILNSDKVRFRREDSNVCIFTDIKVKDDTIRIYNGHVASIRFQKTDYRFMDELKEGDKELKPVIKDGLGVLERLNIAYKKRAPQVRDILEDVKWSPYPVVVCGDFNDTPVSYSYGLLSENLTDSFLESGWGIGNTYIGKMPSFRIDYIFHSPELKSEKYHTLPANISDHHGISTTIFWE